MKNKHIVTLISIVLAIISCKTPQILSTKYKGQPLYSGSVHSDISSIPSVDFESTMTDSIAIKIDSVVRFIYTDQEATALSVNIMDTELGNWNLDTGFVSLERNELVNPETLFYWASVGKMVTACIVQQLIEEQKLSKDDVLKKWFPDIQLAEVITIQHLLEHRSGIFSFDSDTTNFDANDKEEQEYVSPEQLVLQATSNLNRFPAGQYWSYSNTGYIILALIIEKVEGETYSEIVKTRIADKFGFTSFRALERNEQPLNLAQAYDDTNIEIEANYSQVFGAGNIVSSSKEVNQFLVHLLKGDIIPENILFDATDNLYPMFDSGTYYGQGIMVYDFSQMVENEQSVWIGHSGGTPYLRTISIYSPYDKCFVSVAWTKAIPAEALAYQVLKVLKRYKNIE